MTRVLLSAIIAFAALGATHASDVNASSEYQLKAIFLLNFASFVEWPAADFSTPDAPLVIGVFGQDPFAGALDEAARKKSINGRRVVIRVTSDPAVLRSCHVVFFPASQMRGHAKAAAALSGLNILTVGETSDFTSRGGIVNFVIRDSRLGFEVNIVAAGRGHLKISSKLLQLAVSVER